jgi:predicted HTH transcriptional regulator
MITKEELQALLNSTETYRIEKTISTSNKDKFCEAICAFANDMPNSRKPGYLLIVESQWYKKNSKKMEITKLFSMLVNLLFFW